jgi:hypothetical protein
VTSKNIVVSRSNMNYNLIIRIWLLLVATWLESCLGISSIINYLYGGEYQQAVEGFTHTILVNFNENDYFGDLAHCYVKNNNPGETINELNSVIVWEYNYYKHMNDRPQTKIGTPLCQYQVEAFQAFTYESIYHFNFIIKYINCKMPSKYYGGAVFDIFAMNGNSLTTCQYFHRNMTMDYLVTCRLPNIDILLKGNEKYDDSHDGNICLNMTIMLQYELYDGYTEILSRSSIGSNHFDVTDNHPLKIILSNYQQYCSSQTTPSPISKEIISFYSPLFPLKIQNLHWYSGLWYHHQSWRTSLREEFSSPLINRILSSNNFIPSTTFQSLRNHPIEYNDHIIQQLKSIQISDINIPKSYKLDSSVNLSSSYQFLPTVSKLNELRIHRNDVDHVDFMSDFHSRQFYFLGPSYMKSLYDAFKSFLSIENSQNNSLPNLHYEGRIFMTHQASYIEELCQLFNKNSGASKTNALKKTIIISAGAWDLAFAPLRVALRASYTSAKLLSLVEELIQGKHECLGLHRIIWVTAPPFSLCYSYNEMYGSNYCESQRGYRSNAGIAALNQHHLNHLLNILVETEQDGTRSYPIQLSIVDLHSILKPRLIVNDFVELINDNHILFKQCGNCPIVYTPSGLAFFETFLNAVLS